MAVSVEESEDVRDSSAVKFSESLTVEQSIDVKPETTTESRKRSREDADNDNSSSNNRQSLKKFKVPRLSFIPNNIRTRLHVKDLRDLITYVVADGKSPNWLAIQNRTSIKRIVSVWIPSIYPQELGYKDLNELRPVKINADGNSPAKNLTFLKERFEYLFPIKAPGNRAALHSPFEEFTEVPLTKEERKQKTIDEKNPISIKAIECILSPQQLADNNYPLHPKTSELLQYTPVELKEGWVDTEEGLESDKEGNIFGMDCEMCETAKGLVVTRITVVGFDNTTLYDELVKPIEPITNYLTQFSGITEDMLRDVTKTLFDAQKDLLKMINAKDILVGHSLENDLNVLQIRHPLVIDTAVLYGSRGTHWKPSLRSLTSTHLSRDIQKGSNGHDSVEDSIACLDLVKLKLKYGLNFGVKKDTKNIADRLYNSSQGRRTSIIIDKQVNKWTETSASLIHCSTDAEIVDKTVANCNKANFIWSRLTHLHNLRSVPKSDETGSNESLDIGAAIEGEFEALNSNLKRIYDSLPAYTMMLVWTGFGDQRRMRELHAQKRQFQMDYNTKKWDQLSVSWSDKDNQALLRATEKARMGAAFVTLKGADESEHEAKKVKKE